MNENTQFENRISIFTIPPFDWQFHFHVNSVFLNLVFCIHCQIVLADKSQTDYTSATFVTFFFFVNLLVGINICIAENVYSLLLSDRSSSRSQISQITFSQLDHTRIKIKISRTCTSRPVLIWIAFFNFECFLEDESARNLYQNCKFMQLRWTDSYLVNLSIFPESAGTFLFVFGDNTCHYSPQ